MAYTPGLQIKEKTRYRVARMLPIPGEVLVEVGQRVRADEVIAQASQPGEIYPVNLSNFLATSPAELPKIIERKPGEPVHLGDRLAISKGIFGYFRKAYHSQFEGTLESVSNVTGQAIIRGPAAPVQVNAFVAGEVVEVVPGSGAIIETNAAFLQGIFGIGGERHGVLRVITSSPEIDLTPEILTPDLKQAVVVAGRRIHGQAVTRARELGITAIIAGGIDDQDLKEILGYDLGVAITGQESIGLTIIITEGFGEIAMARKTFSLLQSLQGQIVSVNGATQIRAGVMRPEIVVPLASSEVLHETAARVGGGMLEQGAQVRIIRDPWFGQLGTVTGLPVDPTELESGSKARVLEVRCESGQTVIVPRANVEIVAE